jgi:lysine-specific demethylase 8
MEHNSLISNLLSFVEDEDELRDSVKGINECVNKTFQVCWNTCNNLNEKTSRVFEIESVLDYLYDELNTGHWSEVPLKVRKAFTAASFAKTIIILKTTMTCTHCIIEECLKTLDMGILLGAPLENNSDVLTNCATFLSKQLNNTPNCESTQKIETTMKVKSRSQYFDNFENLKGVTVDTLSCPSLETFNNKYFSKKVPLKLQDCVSHWPALTKWPDVNYLLKIAGDRTVPVEIGSHYADENWRQKLMTLKDFIKNYFLGESDSIGYLAQHNLFNQVQIC